MTKIQKIWLGVSAAMFVVPEVLWSPVGNLVYSLLGLFQNSDNAQILRPNFLTNSDNINLLLYFLVIQLIGIIGSLILVSMSKLNVRLKLLVIIILSVVLIITGFVFYIAFSLRHGISY